MNFARHSISATTPVVIFDARFDADTEIFTATTPAGFAVYRVWPLTLIRKRGVLINIIPTCTKYEPLYRV
jgi:WD repeat-containing protein 45